MCEGGLNMCQWCKTKGKTGRTYWECDPDGDGISVCVSPESRELQIAAENVHAFADELMSMAEVHLGEQGLRKGV
jgi:hypothetical protein